MNASSSSRTLSKVAAHGLEQTAAFSETSGKGRRQGDNSRVYYMVCVDQAGESTAQVKLVGHEKDDQVNRSIGSIAPQLSSLADAVVEATRRRGENITERRGPGISESDEALADIQKIVKDLSKIKDFFPEPSEDQKSGSSSSWLQSPFDAAVRLLSAHLLASTFQAVGQDGLGCEEKVYAAGKKVLDARNNHVQSAANHSNTELGVAKQNRPNLQCFARNGMSAMCLQCLDSWRDRNTLTSFLCAFNYSLMQGQHISQVDIWNISEAGTKPPRKSKKKEQTGQAKAKTGQNKLPGIEKWMLVTWPGSKRHHKALSREANLQMLKMSLLAIYNGGFWMLPHVKEYPENFAKCQTPPEFLTQQVFEFAVQQLDLEKQARGDFSLATGVAEAEKDQVPLPKKMPWWTSAFDRAQLEAIWTDPEKAGCRWIPVSAFDAAQSLGLSFNNLVSFQQLRTPSLEDETFDADVNSQSNNIGAAKTVFEEIVRFCFTWSKLKSDNQATSDDTIVGDDVAMFVEDSGVGSQFSVDRTTSQEELLLSPSQDALNSFRATFQENWCAHPLIVVLNNVYVGYAHAHAPSTTLVDLPRQVYAVFSWHDDVYSAKYQPAVVFAVTHDRSDLDGATLATDPIFYPQGHLAKEWWTVVNKDEVGSISEASLVGGMLNKVVGETGVKKILSCDAMLTEVVKADFLERLFCDSESGPVAFWTIRTEGLAAQSNAFPRGLAPIGMAVEHAMEVGGKAGPRPLKKTAKGSCVSRWADPFFERTERRWVNTRQGGAGPAFRMADCDSSPALFVDLVNMEELKSTISGRGLRVSKVRWVFIIIISVDFQTRQLKQLQVFVPSWLQDVRFDENSKFIVLVHEEKDKYSVVACVPKFGVPISDAFVSTKKTTAKLSAVFRGGHLQKYAKTLWTRIVETSPLTHVRFRVDQPPRAWLRNVRGFQDVSNFCCSLGLLLPPTPPDGDCLIWSVFASIGAIPCLSVPEGMNEDEKAEVIKTYRTLHQAVVRRGRQMMAAVILGLHDALEPLFGKNYYDAMFAVGDKEYKERWVKMTARNKGDCDPRCPGNWCSDLEIAALCCAVGVNMNLLFKGHCKYVFWLKDVTVRPFRRVMSKVAYVTLSDNVFDNFPHDTCIEFQDGALSELQGFVTVNSAALHNVSNSPGYFSLVGLDVNHFTGGFELPSETLEQVVSKGLLQATFGQTQTSGFVVHEGVHYEPMMPFVSKLRPDTHTFFSLDCISQRLQNVNECSTSLSHLMEVEVRSLLDATNKHINGLSTVHSCLDNETIADVCRVYQKWNPLLNDDALYAAHKEELEASRFFKSKSLSRSSEKPVTGRLVGKVKLCEGTLLEVPLDADVCRGKLAQSAVWSDRVFWNTVVTLYCSKARMQAADLHLHAHRLLFRITPAFAQSEHVEHVAAGPQPNICAVGLRLFFGWFTRAEQLAHILCNCDEQGKGWFNFYDEVSICIRLLRSASKQLAWCTYPQYDLWNAACARLPKAGQNGERSLTTNLPFLKGFLVTASTFETSGRAADKAHETRLRDEATPLAVVFPSLIGGWGLFACWKTLKNKLVTEYAGRVISHAEATELRKTANASHVRTVVGQHSCLDSRIQEEIGLTMQYYVQNQQVTVL